MAINRVSGNILNDNLQRGANLSVQGNLIYFDVTNDRVGILTSTPAHAFTVSGTANVANLLVDASSANAVLYAGSSRLVETTGNLGFDGSQLTVIGSAVVDNVTIDGSNIESSGSLVISAAGNIDLLPVGGSTNIGNVLVDAIPANRVVITGSDSQITSTASLIFEQASNLFNVIGEARIDDVLINGNSISTWTANTDLNLSSSGTGEVIVNTLAVSDLSANRVVYSQDSEGTLVDSANLGFDGSTLSIIGALSIDNIAIDGNTVTSTAGLDFQTAANGNIVLETDGTGIVKIPDPNGVVIPVGNSDQRPGTPDTGTMRFNTTLEDLEIYNGVAWETVGASGNTFIITNQTINPDGVSNSFVLTQDATSASILLTINGISQTPDTDYFVSGNVLDMSTVPLSTDTIQVRYLAGLETIDRLTNSSANARIQVTSFGNIDFVSTGSINATGNLLPAANVTYDIGSSSKSWRDLYLSGNSIYLGNLIIQDAGTNQIAFFLSDGITPATVDPINVDISSISNGASEISIAASSGNASISIGGVTDVAKFTTAGMEVTGNITASQGFANGNSRVLISANGNITANVAGNIISQTHTGGLEVFGTISTAGNINTGNLLAALITSTDVVAGNITGSSLAVGNITNNNANGVGNIGNASSYFNTVFARATSAQYADLAEKFRADEEYDPGTVLVFGGSAQVTACDSYADSRAAGIVTTDPAHLMNSAAPGITAAIALAGQIPCKVCGPVSKGDLLTTSTRPGYAQRLDPKHWNPGAVIAKALEDSTQDSAVILVATWH